MEPGAIAVRNPTRPKLTPSTGTSLPRNRVRARSIVPSPPSTIARSGCPSPSTSSTPCSLAIASRRAIAGSTSSLLPLGTTDAVLTDCIVDPPVEAGWELGALSVDEVEDELTVSLRAWQARVYDPARLATAREQRFRDVADDAGTHRIVADDALRRVLLPGFELRLDEHECLPPRRGESKRRRQRDLHRDERDVARDDLRRERELAQPACVHALHHDHARVVADLRMQLAIADVERDHARGSALQQHVGEPAGRRADVERVDSRDIDPQRVEHVRELVPCARHVWRRLLDLER